MSELIDRARKFATRAHQRIDQRRKYSDQPYDVHLEAVARLVAAATEDAEMIAAAWLHDVVEDTPATLEDVQREFGASVAALVRDLTDVSRPSDGNRAARKEIDRRHMALASPRAKTMPDETRRSSAAVRKSGKPLSTPSKICCCLRMRTA